ncbi:hypothetical protein Y886_10725 [Xanthomonas hyacinthi DSM 19077]|nr:hypothetical protein Y886_10725 [Xanthomonas hyacinthi DSM 19077]
MFGKTSIAALCPVSEQFGTAGDQAISVQITYQQTVARAHPPCRSADAVAIVVKQRTGIVVFRDGRDQPIAIEVQRERIVADDAIGTVLDPVIPIAEVLEELVIPAPGALRWLDPFDVVDVVFGENMPFEARWIESSLLQCFPSEVDAAVTVPLVVFRESIGGRILPEALEGLKLALRNLKGLIMRHFLIVSRIVSMN